MADNTISPVVPNVSGGRNVSTGQKAVTQTAAQSGIDFKSYLGGRTAVQDNSTTFLKLISKQKKGCVFQTTHPFFVNQ